MDANPIHIDPLLAEVFELLHRMAMCQTLAPFQWMAGNAIDKLQKYEDMVRSERAAQASNKGK